jgi:hypothetical protein
MGQLERQETVKSIVSQSRNIRSSSSSTRSFSSPGSSTSFSSRYNWYDGNKHGTDYLYPTTREVMGTWKHFNLSGQTIRERNARATSPLISRELDRYYGTNKRVDYLGDVSSGGATDFRYYRYRRVPYLGGSAQYKFLPKMIQYINDGVAGI